MIISHSRKFIFVHIHKTAGESITRALAPHLAYGDLVLGTTFLGKIRNAYFTKRHHLGKHATAQAIRDFIGPEVWNAYYKFSIVRNPLTRARSLYYYYEKMDLRRRSLSPKNALLLLPGRDPRKWPGMQAYHETASFAEFIRHPKFNPTVIGAWRQADILSDAEARPMMDFVGRFESLQQDFATAAAAIGLPGATLGWTNASRNSSLDDADLSEADRTYFIDLYRQDYDAFGYPIA